MPLRYEGRHGGEGALFRRDGRAVVELPFKLVIAGIIVVITMSFAFAGLDSYSEASLEDRVDTAVAELVAAAGDVATMGINSSVKVKLDLSASPFHRVESFVVGCGPDDDDRTCKGVEYSITGHRSKWVVVQDHAGNDMVLKGRDRKVVLGDGAHELLLLKCVDHLEVVRV